jgi:hypothetical protein
MSTFTLNFEKHTLSLNLELRPGSECIKDMAEIEAALDQLVYWSDSRVTDDDFHQALAKAIAKHPTYTTAEED